MPENTAAQQPAEHIAINGSSVSLPSGEFVANASFVRTGDDLSVSSPDGKTIIIDDYFAQATPPNLTSPDGAFVPHELVDAFLPPQHAGAYAAADQGVASDASPAGQITEVVGSVTVIRADGTRIEAKSGTAIQAGDVIETSSDGAANILFADNTTFAISESARLSVDEFAYSAGEQSGTSLFSMMQGVFVYTSGLIGKNDPGNVNIETPVGSIGIRGTVVAGSIQAAGKESNITIVDGAIVVSNQAGTIELNDSFETARMTGAMVAPQNVGQINPTTFAQTYSGVADIASDTFQTIRNNSLGRDAGPDATDGPAGETKDSGDDTAPVDAAPQEAPEGETEGAVETKPVVETAEQLPPAPTVDPALVTAPTNYQFSTTAQTGVIGATPPPPPPTGIAPPPVGAMQPPPPPAGVMPPPPPPNGTGTQFNAVKFAFSAEYRNFTPANFDDGIPLFGMDGFGPGTVVGQGFIQNPTLPVGNISYQLVYRDGMGTTQTLTTNGNIEGKAYKFNTGTGDPYDTIIDDSVDIMSFNATTGQISVVDPLSLNRMINDFNYVIQAVDNTSGQVISSHAFVLQTRGFATGPVFLGTLSNDGSTIGTPLGTGGIQAFENSTVYADNGNDRVFTNTTDGFGQIFMGSGNDLTVVGKMNFGNIDGGMGMDRVVLNRTGVYDFINTNMNKMKNIESIEMVNGTVLKLNIQDIFEMTDVNKTLNIKMNDTGQTGQLYIDLSSFAFDAINSTGVPTIGSQVGNGTVVYTGSYQGANVTLVIEQGGSTDGVVINTV